VASRTPPVTALRDWLDHWASDGRLAVIRPDVDLRYQFAAISKRLDGRQATSFPHPNGHGIPAVSGLPGDRFCAGTSRVAGMPAGIWRRYVTAIRAFHPAEIIARDLAARSRSWLSRRRI